VKRVVISRVATVTALGEGLPSLWQGLMEGRSGIAELKRFDCHNYISRYAACIDGLRAPENGSLLDDILERIALQLGSVPADCRLLIASTKGEVDRLTSVTREQAQIPEAVLFEPLLSKVAQRFGLSDKGCNINAACASSTIAVMRASAMIAAGKADAVLVYAADLVSEFVFSGFSALQALSGEPSRPFDQQRKGLNLGEAGVALLLMSEERAKICDEQPMAYVAGWGAANDAHHVTAPAKDGCGLILACRQALGKAGIQADQIAAINAHGTGTVYNDAMELTAFNTVFNSEIPPVHGVKGSLGHCLGAAGGVEIAIACQALKEQKIPGTVGCLEAEEAGQKCLSQAPQEFSGNYILSSNSGFGGINGVVILQGGDR
jgi:3-oxoacyl-[acyl-carrier-protein] synthase II